MSTKNVGHSPILDEDAKLIERRLRPEEAGSPKGSARGRWRGAWPKA